MRKGERTEQRLLAERVEPQRKAADGAILDEDARDAAKADQPGQRDRQRGQADIGDPEAVEEPGDEARQQRRERSPTGTGTPIWKSQARTQAARPITEATDRSISPLMMISVMISATMIFSIDSWNRFTMLSTPR